MRDATPEKIQALRLKIKSLEEEWKIMNRPHINTSLKSSMITRISELKGALCQMEKMKAKKNKPKRKKTVKKSKA